MTHEAFIINLDDRVKDVVGNIKLLNKADDQAWDMMKGLKEAVESLLDLVDNLDERIKKLEELK